MFNVNWKTLAEDVTDGHANGLQSPKPKLHIFQLPDEHGTDETKPHFNVHLWHTHLTIVFKCGKYNCWEQLQIGTDETTVKP
jgi:hypothetical protein